MKYNLENLINDYNTKKKLHYCIFWRNIEKENEIDEETKKILIKESQNNFKDFKF